MDEDAQEVKEDFVLCQTQTSKQIEATQSLAKHHLLSFLLAELPMSFYTQGLKMLPQAQCHWLPLEQSLAVWRQKSKRRQASTSRKGHLQVT